MNAPNPVFQSRWGFHPCSYELVLKLKRLHKWYWQTLYDFHRWHRWRRKETQNRSGPEPRYCPAFVNDMIWYKPVRIRGEAACKVYPKTVVDHGVVDLYHAARMPQDEPPTPFEPIVVEKIAALYCQAAQYFNK